MRVITGKFKGRTLVAPKGDARPTLDRMKETLFNIINSKLQGATILDLFAGSGQLAIECLSRGASRAITCDNSKDSVLAIKTNFAKIGVEPELYFCDYSQCLNSIALKVDLVLVDPPYMSDFYGDVLQKICQKDLLAEDGWVICEHALEINLPDQIADLHRFDDRKMGNVKFSFYKRS